LAAQRPQSVYPHYGSNDLIAMQTHMRNLMHTGKALVVRMMTGKLR